MLRRTECGTLLAFDVIISHEAIAAQVMRAGGGDIHAGE
jgi:hypothetical protein